MSTTKPVWTILLASLTAIVVFLTHSGIRPGALEESADVAGDWSATHLREHPMPSIEPAGPRPAPQPLQATAPSIAAQEELAAMSETFRNTTLLMAIRQSGYVCADMLGADQAADDVAAWRVRCSDAVAYLVAVDAVGNLSVDAISYMEGFQQFRSPQELLERDSTRLDRLR